MQKNVIDQGEVVDAKDLFLRDVVELGYILPFVAELSGWGINSLHAIYRAINNA